MTASGTDDSTNSCYDKFEELLVEGWKLLF